MVEKDTQDTMSEDSTRTNRRTVLRATGAAGAAGIAGLSGCLSNIGGSGGSDNVAKFGVLSPMTGPYSSLAPSQRKGAKLGIKYVNESDEFDFTIKAEYADTEATPSVATRKANKLISKFGATILMGEISSAVALALNAFALDNEVVYGACAAAVPITGKKCNRFVFRAETNTAQVAEAAAVWTPKHLGSNVWFHIADYAYGHSVLKEWSNRMEAADVPYNLVNVTKAKLGAKNFGPYISQIKNSNADVVVVGSTGGDLVRFVKQAKNRNLHKQTKIMAATGSFQVVRKVLGQTGVGLYSGVRWNPELDIGYTPEFVSAYEDEYGTTPGNFARVAYDTVRMFAQGIREAGSANPEDFIPAMAGLQVDSISGPNKFRTCNHQAMNPVWVGKNVESSDNIPDVKLLDKKSGKEAIPPCSEIKCSL